MASLMELIERVNRGELIDPAQLEIYQESSNSAEKFLAHRGKGHRSLREGRFLIIYYLDEDTIYITDFFDTKQHPAHMRG